MNKNLLIALLTVSMVTVSGCSKKQTKAVVVEQEEVALVVEENNK